MRQDGIVGCVLQITRSVSITDQDGTHPICLAQLVEKPPQGNSMRDEDNEFEGNAAPLIRPYICRARDAYVPFNLYNAAGEERKVWPLAAATYVD